MDVYLKETHLSLIVLWSCIATTTQTYLVVATLESPLSQDTAS